MMHVKSVGVDYSQLPESYIESPERGLIAGIIYQAIHDAKKRMDCNSEENAAAYDGIDFLFSDRAIPYCELLELDHEALREGLLGGRKMPLTSLRNRYKKWKYGPPEYRLMPLKAQQAYNKHMDEEEEEKEKDKEEFIDHAEAKKPSYTAVLTAKYEQASALVAGGMSKMEACKQAGLLYDSYMRRQRGDKK